MTLLLVATDDGVVPFLDGIAGPRELAGREVAHLARWHDGWMAIADGRTVVERSADGEWRELGTADVTLTCVLPRPHGATCGSRDGHLLRLHEGKWSPIEAFDAVEGRDTWHAVGSDVPYVRSIAVTSDDGALLANVHVGGIPRSGNGGASWRPTIDPEADVHEVRAHPDDPKVVLAAAAVGLAISRDGGVTWSITTAGLHATYLRAVTFTWTGALVSASDGPFTSRGALYRWDASNGDTLERATEGLPEWLDGNVDTHNLDADREAVACADESAVYASRDQGASWVPIATDLGRARGIGVTAS